MEQQENEKLMTISELAEFLNVKVSWVRATVFKREIPFVKVGHHVRFTKDDILLWMKTNRVFG